MTNDGYDEKPCDPTLMDVARTLYNDPERRFMTPGVCRVCKRRLKASHATVETGFGALTIPIASCERVAKLAEGGNGHPSAYSIVEQMRVEARKRRKQSEPEERRRDREQVQDYAKAALGISDDLGIEVDSQDEFEGW